MPVCWSLGRGGGSFVRARVLTTLILALAGAFFALAPGAAAQAQSRDAPKDLWEAFPLDREQQSQTAAPPSTSEPSPDPQAQRPVRTEVSEQLVALLPYAVMAFLAGAFITWLIPELRSRRSRSPARPPAPVEARAATQRTGRFA